MKYTNISHPIDFWGLIVTITYDTDTRSWYDPCGFRITNINYWLTPNDRLMFYNNISLYWRNGNPLYKSQIGFDMMIEVIKEGTRNNYA